MYEGDSSDTCAGKFPLVLIGGRAEGLACADPGARTPIDASGNFILLVNVHVGGWRLIEITTNSAELELELDKNKNKK
jgi:hypothetical protein